MLKKKIEQVAEKITGYVVQCRQHLHAHPELSFEEFETAAFIKKELTAIGLEWQAIGNTGVTAVISGQLPSDNVIALRADIDALPILEQNDLSYTSTRPGIMHACGHDAHTASLLGVARILVEIKPYFKGTIKLIFQPAEERLPGGAATLIKEGVLENPAPAFVIGQHVMPSIPAGKIGLRSGIFMASIDELRLSVKGRGGHAAQPNQNIDPVLIGAQIVVALQQIVSRNSNPFTPTVVAFGKFIANGTTNIIPDEVYIEGTFRTMDETWRREAHKKMKEIARGMAESMGGSCDFTIVEGYPFLINNEALSSQVEQYAAEYMGKDRIVHWEPWMASEDFAYYSQVKPACFYLLGVGNPAKGITSSLHTATFNIDEEALTISSGLMSYIALKTLGN